MESIFSTSHTPLAFSVSNILHMSSDKQMVWVYATRHVTLMQDVKTIRNLTLVYFP